jgi:hypothetical protein
MHEREQLVHRGVVTARPFDEQRRDVVSRTVGHEFLSFYRPAATGQSFDSVSVEAGGPFRTDAILPI